MSTVTSINLSEHGLIAIHCANDDDACAFYNATRSLPYIKYGASDESFFIFKAPGAGRVVEGYALFEDVVYLPPYAEDIELEGTLDEVGDIPEALLLKTEELPNFPELPAEFFRQAQQSSLFDDIPNQLKRFDQWVLWRYAERGGKTTKLPFQPTGGMAKSNDPATWSSFESVRHTFAEGGSSGIGFVLSEQDGLAGIDLDKCYDPVTKTFTQPEAEEIVRRALEVGTYVEISPSGSGIRIFVAGSLERSGKAPGELSWIEAYDHRSARYLTVTGHNFEGSVSEIKPGQAFLDWLHDTYLKKPERPKAIPQAEVRPERDDEELIRHIRSSRGEGTRFAELFDQGNHVNGETGEVNEDRSAADFALCGILARWTERNAAQMDRVFRRSALMRDKWDERHASDGRTYGQITVENAITGCDQTREEWLLDRDRAAQDSVDRLKRELLDIMASGERPRIISADTAGLMADLNTRGPDEAAIFYTTMIKPELGKLKPAGVKDFERLLKAVGRSRGAAEESEQGYVQVINERFVIIDGDDQNKTGTYEFTRNEFGQRVIKYRGKDEMTVSLADKPVDYDEWMASPQRRTAKKLRFLPPPLQVPDGTINAWPGFTCKPAPGEIPNFEELVRDVIADGNLELEAYLWDWWAYLYQNPATKLLPVPVISGAEGAGKTQFVQRMSAMLGCATYIIQSPDQLRSEFNAFLETNVLIYIAESAWAGDHQLKEKLKTLISEKETSIRKMRTDGYKGNNFASFIITANNDWAVPAGKDARRYVLINAGDKRQQDTTFFKALDTEMQNGGREALLNRLLSRDVSQFDPNTRPQTGAGWKTILNENHNLKYLHEMLSRNSEEQWEPHKNGVPNLFSKCESVEVALSLKASRKVPRSHLKRDAELWARALNQSRNFIRLDNEGMPGLIRKIFGEEATGKCGNSGDAYKMAFATEHRAFRERGYEFPPLPEAQELFATYLGASVGKVFEDARAFADEEALAEIDEDEWKENRALDRGTDLVNIRSVLKLSRTIEDLTARRDELLSESSEKGPDATASTGT